MSAVCGVIRVGDGPVHATDLSECLDALSAFAPGDEPATWAGRAGGVGVALGARDPQAASLVRSQDGRLALAADVLLDCRRELIDALGGATASFSDPQLILAAYERWGEACLERLSGEFAFALADDRRGGVLLARDQLGCRPLVLHERDGVVSFASTAHAVAELDGVGYELDEARVGEWLAFVMRSEATFIAGASLMAQGHAMWIDEASSRSWRYWSVDASHIVDLGSSEAHAQALRDVLDDAVRRRLPDSGATGVLLSGGLDSTSVAATAARLLAPGTLHSYTAVAPEGWTGPTEPNFDPDEGHLVNDLASWHPNLSPRFVDAHEGSLFGRHDALFAAGAPPLRNPCNALWQTTAFGLAAADGVTRLLTGARGNLFFSADDPRWLVDLLRRGRLRTLRYEIGAAARATRRSGREVAREALVRELTPAFLLQRRRDRRGELDPYADLALRSAGRTADAVVREHFQGLDNEERTKGRDHAVLAVMAQGGGLAESMAVLEALTGVRMVDPTGDVRLIEVCAMQPSWYRRRDGRRRAVVRDAMADRLPSSIAERTRRGAQLPDWLERMTAARAELHSELAAARDSDTCRRLLDLDRIAAALDDWPDRERQTTRQREVNRTYRYMVLRGLFMARYLRFFEDHSRARARASSSSARAA